jgi:hypothetical protein
MYKIQHLLNFIKLTLFVDGEIVGEKYVDIKEGVNVEEGMLISYDDFNLVLHFKTKEDFIFRLVK